MPDNRPDPLDLEPQAFIGSEPPDAAPIAYADDQDPSLLTDAGLVALAYARRLERAYVYARMQAVMGSVEEGHLWRPLALMRAHHEGGCSIVVHVAELSAAPDLFRGPERLDRIAGRILLGRARRALRADPEDPLPRAIIEHLVG